MYEGHGYTSMYINFFFFVFCNFSVTDENNTAQGYDSPQIPFIYFLEMPSILGNIGEWFPVPFCMDWNLQLLVVVRSTLSYL